MAIRGVRGATSIEADQPELVYEATRELLVAMLEANDSMRSEDIASVIFTVTADISSAFPAQAARQFGWGLVPMICAREIPVPGSLPLAIRVLLHWNTDIPQSGIRHTYLRKAVRLRPDLVAAQ